MTWATWGDLTVDSGREMYVPAMLAAGKMLYRDIWFFNSPAAPYFNSYLFRIFGVHLNALYWAGSIAALGSAIFLYFAGLSLGSRLIGWSAGAVVLIEGFRPEPFCFPLPYSFSSVYGCLTACAFLWFVIEATRSGRWVWMFAAATAAALALLLKLEFGAACYGMILLLIAANGVRQRSWNPVWTGALAVLPGLLVCAGVARWMVSISGSDFITQENYQSWPTSYFMKTYGKTWLANTGFRLSRAALIGAFGRICVFAAAVTGLYLLLKRKRADGRIIIITGASLIILHYLLRVASIPTVVFLFQHALLAYLLGVTILVGFAACVYVLLRRQGTGVGSVLLILGLGVAALICLAPIIALEGLFPLSRIFFPQDMVLIVGIAAVACWGYAYRKRNRADGLTLVVLFTFPTMLAFRILMGMRAEGYPIFYNGTAVLAFLFLVSRLIRQHSSGSRKINLRAEYLACCCCLFWVITQQKIFADHHKYLAPLVTERGVIWAPSSKVAKYQDAIGFMKEKAARGQSVISIPEDTSLYFLSATVCPTRVYAFTPGMLVPGRMTQNVIDEIDRKKVRYLLWSNRTFVEYGVPVFGKDYDLGFAAYLTSHYRQIGPLGDYDEHQWSAMVWERINE